MYMYVCRQICMRIYVSKYVCRKTYYYVFMWECIDGWLRICMLGGMHECAHVYMHV